MEKKRWSVPRDWKRGMPGLGKERKDNSGIEEIPLEPPTSSVGKDAQARERKKLVLTERPLSS